jgi:hypothetical protein
VTESEFLRDPYEGKVYIWWENGMKLVKTNFYLKNKIFENIYEKKYWCFKWIINSAPLMHKKLGGK